MSTHALSRRDLLASAHLNRPPKLTEMLLQPMESPPTGSTACTATVPHFQADTETAPSAGSWYQHLDSLIIMEDLESGPTSVSSMIEALVPDGADSPQQQQLDSQVAAPAAYLPASTAAADTSAPAGLYSAACGDIVYSAHDQSDAVLPEPAAAAYHGGMPYWSAAWSAAGPSVTAAEGYYQMAEWWGSSGDVMGPTHTTAASEAAEAGCYATPRINLQYPTITLTDAGSSNSSPTSLKAPIHSTIAKAVALPAVPAKRGRSHFPIAAKPAAAAAAKPPVGDSLAVRREVNKLSQRRQRYRRQQDVEEVRTQLSEMTDKHTAAKQQLDTLRSEQAALLSRLSEVTAKWQATVSLNASLQQDSTAHQLQIANLQQQLRSVQAQLQQQQQPPAQQRWTHAEEWTSSGVSWQHQHQQAALWG